MDLSEKKRWIIVFSLCSPWLSHYYFTQSSPKHRGLVELVFWNRCGKYLSPRHFSRQLDNKRLFKVHSGSVWKSYSRVNDMLEKCLCWPCCTFWKNLLGPVTEKLSLFFLSCQCLPLKLSVKIYELVLLIYHHIFSLCNWRTEDSLVALIKENNKAGILIKKGCFLLECLFNA